MNAKKQISEKDIYLLAVVDIAINHRILELKTLSMVSIGSMDRIGNLQTE